MDWIGLLPGLCAKYKVDPVLVRAIAMTESNGNTWKTRFEPHWKYFSQVKFYSGKLGITYETETIHQQMSWGVMQVMGAVARELGFWDDLTQLTIPSNGLEMGIKKLAQLQLKYMNIKDVIASYNAGSPVLDCKSGCYMNAEYVGKVLGWMKTFKGG